MKETKFYTSKANPLKDDELKNAADIDFKALNYTELIPVIIKGMQEQQAVINQQQQQIDELKQMVQVLSAQSSSINASANGAYVLQNSPNPFNQSTVIHCYVPSSAKQAQLGIYNMSGKLLKSYPLNSGMNNINISTGTFASGSYIYSLLIDGKKMDSKNMTVTK